MLIGIIGAGRWASTLANLLHGAGHNIIMFGLDTDVARVKQSRQIPHTKFFLDEGIEVITEGAPLYVCDVVFIAVDGKNLSRCWQQWRAFISCPVVIAVKTLNVIDGKLVLPSDIVSHDETIYFGSAAFPEGLLSGSPAIGTVYGQDKLTKSIRTILPLEKTRIYTSTDLVGGQIVHASKNVLAIASGIALGLGLDEMTRAAIVSRGVCEIERFGLHYGAQPETFGNGTSGLADTIGTCYSLNSHNLKAGIRFSGQKLDWGAIEDEIGTVEGIQTVKILSMIPRALEMMPIASAVARILFDGVDPKEVMKELMNRPLI